MTTAVIFPGQGSQRAGMGADLFDRYPGMTQLASDILGFSLRELCQHDPDGRLRDTTYTQPARYVVNALALRAACDDGLVPGILLGHSVGEYTALLGAEVFDFETGLRLVGERARVMARVPGGMSVVLGLDTAAIAEVLGRTDLTGIDQANLNAHDQTVLSGPVALLDVAAEHILAAGASAVRRLDVSGPFHSRYMAAAAREFAGILTEFQLAAPRLPVIANRTAREYPGTAIAEILAEQIDHQVLWADSLDYVLSRDHEAEFVELGGTPTLGGTVRRARQRLAGRQAAV
jgi:malonyl CoA-acyl carrier protein transacylase